MSTLQIEAPAGFADTAQMPGRVAGHRNLLQLVQLRWLALTGQLVTIFVVRHVVAVPLPLAPMLALLAVLLLFNVATLLRARMPTPVSDAELFAALLVDVAVLTGLLYHAGGITNPFIFLYLLPIAVATVLLRPRQLWAMVATTCACFLVLTRWYRPLELPAMTEGHSPGLYAGALLICFLLNAALLVVYIGRINTNLRERDARLADLRQRAAEEEHIVRMGLLASGAAHELGTPLATLSVILGDWSRMAPFAAQPDLREEIEEMQRQLQRCKTIVAGVLQSAGETPAELPAHTTLHAFLDGLVAHWCGGRPLPSFRVQRAGLPDLPIALDAALQQMIVNLLDNAAEAAPETAIELHARCVGGALELRVLDRGPGFPAAMLERLGQPYQSTKGRPGCGLGLFLCVNVTRALGGHFEAHNRSGGGAEVVIRLPLASLQISRGARHGG